MIASSWTQAFGGGTMSTSIKEEARVLKEAGMLVLSDEVPSVSAPVDVLEPI